MHLILRQGSLLSPLFSCFHYKKVWLALMTNLFGGGGGSRLVSVEELYCGKILVHILYYTLLYVHKRVSCEHVICTLKMLFFIHNRSYFNYWINRSYFFNSLHCCVVERVLEYNWMSSVLIAVNNFVVCIGQLLAIYTYTYIYRIFTSCKLR